MPDLPWPLYGCCCMLPMQYGFSSFVHRDRVYKVLQLIWHNSQLHKVCIYTIGILEIDRVK